MYVCMYICTHCECSCEYDVCVHVTIFIALFLACDVLRFLRVFDASCLDFALNRVLMYTMAHTFKVYKFLPRVIEALFNYLQHIAVPPPLNSPGR